MLNPEASLDINMSRVIARKVTNEQLAFTCFSKSLATPEAT